MIFHNTSPVSTGNAFADLLQGNIANYQQTNSKVKYYNRYKILEPYFQDDWHVTQQLTLNLGLRVSLFGTYREKYYQAYNFDPAAYSPAARRRSTTNGSITGQPGALIPGIGNPFDGLVQCGKNGVPRGCMNGHLFNPGSAHRICLRSLWRWQKSIRGGYGIFFEHTNGNEGNTEGLEGSAAAGADVTQYNITGYTNIGGGGCFSRWGRSDSDTGSLALRAAVELECPAGILKSTVLTVAYVGSKGTHLGCTRDINQLFPSPFAEPISAGTADDERRLRQRHGKRRGAHRAGCSPVQRRLRSGRQSVPAPPRVWEH